MTAVIIGVDPHKGSHTATALDAGERELARLKVRAGRRQAEQLLAWAAPYRPGTWAIESANGLGYLLAQQLLAAGEAVLDVPATLAARVRVLGIGRSNKNDPNDARAVAVAALRAPGLIPVRVEDHRTMLRLRATHHTDLARWRNTRCGRLHALVAELVAGGISKEIVGAQASQLLERLDPVGAAPWNGTVSPSDWSTNSTTSTRTCAPPDAASPPRSPRPAPPSPTPSGSARSSPP